MALLDDFALSLMLMNMIGQADAAGVGKLRHKRLVNLIGCCAEGDERLLVAQYMSNDTLSKHLFHCTITQSLADSNFFSAYKTLHLIIFLLLAFSNTLCAPG